MKRQTKTSPAVIAFAAAAYDYLAELDHPCPDPTMRRITLEALRTTHRLLEVEDREYLARIAGRH